MSRRLAPLWTILRPRLVPILLAATVTSAFGLAVRGHVHVGAYPAYRPQPYVPPYGATLIKHEPRTSFMRGWVMNHTSEPCAEVIVWVDSINGLGHIFAGPLAAGDWAYWSGDVRDANAAPIPLAERFHMSAGCYEAHPGHRAPLRST